MLRVIWVIRRVIRFILVMPGAVGEGQEATVDASAYPNIRVIQVIWVITRPYNKI